MYFIIVALIILLDQIVKYLIQVNILLNHTIPIVNGILHFTYIRNSGAAFSLFQNQTTLLIIMPFTVAAVVLVYIFKKRKKEHWIMLLSLSLIAGGGIGNLIDRIAYGYVVDFIDFQVFPIFNVADISVSIGCGLMLLYMFLVEPRLTRAKMEMQSKILDEEVTPKELGN